MDNKNNTMDIPAYDTLSEAMNALTKKGFSESFQAREKNVLALYSKKEFRADQLTVIQHFRFEGMTNPADSTELLAIEASDGTKGTLTMSYGADNDQNSDLIRMIKMKP